ncbi:hypothetical protein GRF29_44g1854149 [Pseudopithomyces chartarum]|uniref:Uncharacterized protein n=1 Tax=Pseudopithomyces chartarum TaxID=1892770 RepID=A0AAN6LZ33_9PLEO|nr:hypothetical protein GRF29_44g1854149 [Pseudopithomyces chartarum]
MNPKKKPPRVQQQLSTALHPRPDSQLLPRLTVRHSQLRTTQRTCTRAPEHQSTRALAPSRVDSPVPSASAPLPQTSAVAAPTAIAATAATAAPAATSTTAPAKLSLAVHGCTLHRLLGC